MTVSRGMDVMAQAKTTMKAKQTKSFFRKIIIEADDGPIKLRFRGLLNYPNLKYTDEQLEGMSEEDLVTHLLYYAGYFNNELDKNGIIESIKNRYNSKEPIFGASHYIDRNKGRKKDLYMNCGDTEALLNTAKDTKCRMCYCSNKGDKGIGFPSRKLVFSFYDYRAQHVIPGAEDNASKYKWCTKANKGFCEHCAYNNKVGDKSENYRKKYDSGMRYLELPIPAAEALIACEQRVMMYCRSCGLGRLTPNGAYCPNSACYQWFDFDDLICSGWDPSKATSIQCQHCNMHVIPEMSYECNSCDNPVASRLYDVDILVSVTEQATARGKRKNFQFVEQIPITPLTLEDELGFKILSTAFIDYENDQFTTVPSVEDQLDFIGITQDPLGEIEIQHPGNHAEQIGQLRAAKQVPPNIAGPVKLPTVVPSVTSKPAFPKASVGAVPVKKKKPGGISFK